MLRSATSLLALCAALASCGRSELVLTGAPEDRCPDDPFKLEPGACGCGTLDADADADGAADCEDFCPLDWRKTEPGACGCGAPDDADADGVRDCESGCADGQREGFADPRFTAIAACSGGFQVPGVRGAAPSAPTCQRRAGDDGEQPNGLGCGVEDLCQQGWHVCRDYNEVAAALPPGATCAAAAPSAGPPYYFFLTRQSGEGAGRCEPSGGNDVFGCGNIGRDPIAGTNCAPFDRFSGNNCADLPLPWRCTSETGASEAEVIAKPGPDFGGVLCCRG